MSEDVSGLEPMLEGTADLVTSGAGEEDCRCESRQ